MAKSSARSSSAFSGDNNSFAASVRRAQSIKAILPNPILLSYPPIIRFIPAHGIKQKLPIIRAAIMERLAIDDFTRKFAGELRYERLQRCGIALVCQPIALERT